MCENLNHNSFPEWYRYTHRNYRPFYNNPIVVYLQGSHIQKWSPVQVLCDCGNVTDDYRSNGENRLLSLGQDLLVDVILSTTPEKERETERV